MSYPSRVLFDYAARLRFVYQLIKMKRTGPRVELARKLHVTVRSVTNYLQMLRSMGAEIEYDRRLKSYYFANGFVLKADLEVNFNHID